MLAQIGEADGKLLAHMLAHRGADTDLVRLRQSLEARRDIHSIAEDVAVLDDDVAHIDADAEPYALALVKIGVAILHSLLQHHGAAHRIDDRRKLDQKAVPRGLDDASLVLGDQRVDELPAVGFERGKRPFLVGAHEPRISGHVSGKDGGEPPRGAEVLAHTLASAAWPDTAPVVDRVDGVVRSGGFDPPRR